MSDANDVWQAGDSYGNGRDGSPRRDDGGRSPRRDRSRSPARNGNGGGERGRQEDGAVQNPGNNLHVSGLARSIDQRYLEDLFGKYGKVQKAQVMFDPHTQESRGFGFVMMENGDDANACIDAINASTVEGKVMTVAHARRGRARTPTPGRYHGVKMDSAPRNGGYGYQDRPYQPRSYDSRYAERGPPPRGYDDRRYDDRRSDDRRYDDRRDYGRDRHGDYRSAPPIDRERDSRGSGGGGGGGYERREERPRYDERPRY